ncbi:TOG array regulator of axonemal microtubules protein 1 [Polymixia lowei]
MMILGLISRELHEQLLDPNNYQNRTNGVEELKLILSELDLKLVPSDSILEFINILYHLLDDSNFKVLYGTLQVLNLLIQKLDSNVDKYFKQIAFVALKALGDTRTVTRNEYMNVFRELMGIVGPQKVVDLVIGNLRHRNSSVREDVLNIILAAMLIHPRKDFNIPNLCFEVAPYLADSKKKVRHAALELFAVFDFCLDTGKKQPLMKAVDMVELNGDVEGLMAAVQARRARHILPWLSSEGIVEYALMVPKPGQRCPPQFGSGADLDWVLNGGRISSARSYRTEPDSDRLYGTNDLPLQRRIVSAGKGKNKLPWEMSRLSSTESDQPEASNGKCSEQVATEDHLSISGKMGPGTYIPSFGTAELVKPCSSRRRESPTCLRRSGRLDVDPDIFKSTNLSNPHGVAPKARILSGNPSVERTFLLTPPLTPTPSHLRADSSLSISNTSPNKRESSPHQQHPRPRRETAGEQMSSRCSPRPPRASLVSSSSTSCIRWALSGTRTTLPISPVLRPMERTQSHNGQRFNHAPATPKNQQLERNLDLDLTSLNSVQDPQENKPLETEEMLNSLRLLRNSAAKKRAKVGLSGSDQDPDPDSPDSAVKLEPRLDSPSNNSPTVTSPASESGFSSLYSPPKSTLNGTKTSPGNSTSSAVKPCIARVPSAKLRCDVSMDFGSLQGLSQREKASPEVGVIGQRVTYSNGPMEPEDEDRTNILDTSSSLVKPTCREPIRALRPAKGSQSYSSRNSPATDMPEGVVGRGVFGSAVLSSRPGVATASEQGYFVAKTPKDPPAGIYGHAVTGNLIDTSDNQGLEETKERVRNARYGRDKTRLQHLDQPEGQFGQLDHAQNKIHWIRQILADKSDLPTEEKPFFDLIYLHLNGSTVASTKADPPPDESPISPTSPSSPPGAQSPIKCFTPPHQPSPPTLPPKPKTLHRLRRARQILADKSDLPMEEKPLFDLKDLHLNGSTVASTKADPPPDESPISPASPSSPPGPQSPIECFNQPSPPTLPPNPKTLRRLRRAPSLSRTQPSLSHSSGHPDELSTSSPCQKRDLTEPPELLPFSKPDLALTQTFELLSSEDWEKKIEGLIFLRRLSQYHSCTLHSRLHDVCLALTQEVKNLRSGVSRVAVCTLGHLYSHLQKTMDQELEGTAKALLLKAGESSTFIRQDVDVALDCMVQYCTPIRSINALLTGGVGHLSAVVRKCTAQHLANLIEKVGAARILSGGKDLTDRILPAVTKLAQDSSQEARYFGRQMLLFLSSHRDFEKILRKYISDKDLATVRDIVYTLKTKGEMPQDTPSARGRRLLPGSGTVRASSLTKEPLNHTNSCSSQLCSNMDKAEYIGHISALLGSKDFRERIKGIDQLEADCQHNPNMVINSIFPVFDAFKARLQESNSKVNLYALESLHKIISMMKDNLSQVVNILVPAIVDNHLNSKNNAIYSAAIGAIDALILNLDNILLLGPFCTKAQFLSGKAKVDLIEKVGDLVTELYPRKPQMVEQKVLPLLWHLLGTSGHSGTVHGRGSSVRGATAKLCQALYAQMGPSLAKRAVSQPANVHRGLNEFLRTLSYP